MSNEILTKLMDPLEKGYNVDVAGLIGSEGFGDKERKEELCTLAAKWYLDASGGDRTTETKEIPTLDELEIILADENAHEIYVFKTEDWKKAIGALGADKVPVGCLYPDTAEPYIWDSSVTIQNMVWDYFKNHVADILAKIQEIQETRNAHAIADKEQENTETKSPEQEILEDLEKLRDLLNMDNIDIFDLMPDPVYGAKTAVTTEDFVIWFAKKMVGRRIGLSERGLSDKFYDYNQGFVNEYCDGKDALKIVALFGLPRCAEQNNRARVTANASLEEFWKTNKDEIISKVKEITKLWLEHGLI